MIPSSVGGNERSAGAGGSASDDDDPASMLQEGSTGTGGPAGRKWAELPTARSASRCSTGGRCEVGGMEGGRGGCLKERKCPNEKCRGRNPARCHVQVANQKPDNDGSPHGDLRALSWRVDAARGPRRDAHVGRAHGDVCYLQDVPGRLQGRALHGQGARKHLRERGTLWRNPARQEQPPATRPPPPRALGFTMATRAHLRRSGPSSLLARSFRSRRATLPTSRRLASTMACRSTA